MRKAVVFFAVAAVFAGCSGCSKADREKPDPYKVAGVEERMADQEYVQALKDMSALQRELAKKRNSATNDAERAAANAELEALRQESTRRIRERMLAK